MTQVEHTGKVTSIYGMFDLASSFNGNESSWDTCEVSTLSWMLHNAASFNADLSKRKTSQVNFRYIRFNTLGIILLYNNIMQLLFIYVAMPLDIYWKKSY